MQVCTSLQTDNHASTPPLFFTGHPTNSVKALKAQALKALAASTDWYIALLRVMYK